MHQVRNCRRLFLRSSLADAGGLLLVGCGEGEKAAAPKPEEDPSVKAKDSMEFYKNNALKKK